MSARIAKLALALALAAAGAPGPARAIAVAPLRVRVRVSPPAPHLGEPVLVVAEVTGTRGVRVRLYPPDTSADLTWGPMSSRMVGLHDHREQPDTRGDFTLQGMDTVRATMELRVFRIGPVSLPGQRLEVDDGTQRRTHRMPTARLVVIPLIAANDSTADLRPLRGPLPAPWWERVPWTWVIVGALAVALGVAVVRVARRRRRPVAPVAAPAAAPSRAPLEEALAALAALRAQRLPEQGRLAEHAFLLGRLLRRFLERTEGTPRPGDTSPELVMHLRQARATAPWVERVEGLLMRWDRVKFARVPATAEEALQAEAAVEALLRRLAAGAGPGRAA